MKKVHKIYPKKQDINALELTAIVLNKPIITEWDNGQTYKAKTTAKVKSIKTDKIIDFVTWKNLVINQGDVIHSVGKIENSGKAFIGWADYTYIIKKSENLEGR